jgi:hypothetical protein
VARYPHLGSDQVYKFYLDPALGFRPRRLEQYFDRTLYRRIDDYRYIPAGGAWLPVSARVTDYAVKEPSLGKIIGVAEMRVVPETFFINGDRVNIADYLSAPINFESYVRKGAYTPPVKEKKHKKKEQ